MTSPCESVRLSYCRMCPRGIIILMSCDSVYTGSSIIQRTKDLATLNRVLCHIDRIASLSDVETQTFKTLTANQLRERFMNLHSPTELQADSSDLFEMKERFETSEGKTPFDDPISLAIFDLYTLPGHLISDRSIDTVPEIYKNIKSCLRQCIETIATTCSTLR